MGSLNTQAKEKMRLAYVQRWRAVDMVWKYHKDTRRWSAVYPLLLFNSRERRSRQYATAGCRLSTHLCSCHVHATDE